MISSPRHFSASYVPRSQIVIVPAPYWPLGISPWNSRYSSGWSSVRTARWLRLGSSGMPLGTAHEASTPSCSSRRSQCRRVAWCSWTTNWPDATGAGAVSPSRPASPAGSLGAVLGEPVPRHGRLMAPVVGPAGRPGAAGQAWRRGPSEGVPQARRGSGRGSRRRPAAYGTRRTRGRGHQRSAAMPGPSPGSSPRSRGSRVTSVTSSSSGSP